MLIICTVYIDNTLNIFLELMTKHGLSTEQVDIKIDKTFIAKHVAHDHWRILAQNLGFSESDISAMTGNSDMEKMLDEWITKNDAKATYSCFIEACFKADISELAEKICRDSAARYIIYACRLISPIQ